MSILLRLADLGILSRTLERTARERRFREFWREVAELRADTAISSTQRRAAASNDGEAAATPPA
jgi:hypothetical protein